ncbi:MAG: hypothetical protein Fur0041_16490 [Bacteroidia bacterium]
MLRMQPSFREWFSFSSSERRGITALLIIILLIVCSRYFISTSVSSEFDKQLLTHQLRTLYRNQDSLNVDQGDSLLAENITAEIVPHTTFQKKQLFYFNPNRLPVNDWMRLGLSKAQAESVKKFEEKSGGFKTKEDLKKVYVISAELFSELEPYIVLPEADQKQPLSHEKREKAKLVIELNAADTNALMMINGIGPVLSSRIVAYREKLGGYYSISQLQEVFGMDAQKAESISEYLKLDSTYIRKIPVNKASVADLRKHPYISPQMANAIVNYRKQHGPYQSAADLEGCKALSKEFIRKINIYLDYSR